jgi:hypothetical protein
MAYNANKVESAKRIRDRGIRWKEVYTKKTMALKKKFEKELGPGSYFRWEGYDVSTGNTYYIVAGPGYSKTKGKLFFSGIRKMPAEYSPNGEYFRTLRKSINYAKEMWGISFPRDFVRDYKAEELAAIRVSN